MSKPTHKDLRKALLETNERVRIKRNGEVHCFGKMPNSNRRGWYLAGFDHNLLWRLEEERRVTQTYWSNELQGHVTIPE